MADMEDVGEELMSNSTNATTLESDRIIHYPRGATIFAAVACIIFILVGIVGESRVRPRRQECLFSERTCQQCLKASRHRTDQD